MFNSTEAEERGWLAEVQRKLSLALHDLDRRIERYAKDIQDQKNYLWEHKADMDHVEKVSARESVEQMMRSGEVSLAARRRLHKLVPSPYFGRIDFVREGNGADVMPVYIGTHSFTDEQRNNVVFDWRAPISALFYDFELGEARYRAPAGVVSGRVMLKRQFRIRKGRMEFMLESGLNILDDVLQEELSRTSDDRMKTIVATIQRDQNAIIRNEDADVLIIQGVAGSGKTSIALHRVAFLLYRLADELSAKDILIISPNKVFADFISNVLPELGEEPIAELEMERLAHELLGARYRFQTSFEQSQALLEGRDDVLRRRVEAKSSSGFLEDLERYARHVEATQLSPVDLPVRGYLVPAAFIEKAFRRLNGVPGAERIRGVAARVEQEVWLRRRHELSAKERAAVRAAVKRMVRTATLRTLYKEFFEWLGRPDLFAGRRGTLEYADVFPLLYLALRLEDGEGLGADYRKIRHLVIDEMQDYTPVQYAVLARLFPCRKTILGDVSQSLNPWSATTAEVIARVFRGAECVTLTKSYRSSYEILQFAQSISPDTDLVPVERPGRKPQVVACRSGKEERERIQRFVERFPGSGFLTMGIVCRTQREAERLHGKLGEMATPVHLLTARSGAFVRGVVVCAAHLAKGLEFDQVLVPHVTAENYTTALDRNLLYVACTRAMHDLILTHAGSLTPFVSDPNLYEV